MKLIHSVLPKNNTDPYKPSCYWTDTNIDRNYERNTHTQPLTTVECKKEPFSNESDGNGKFRCIIGEFVYGCPKGEGNILSYTKGRKTYRTRLNKHVCTFFTRTFCIFRTKLPFIRERRSVGRRFLGSQIRENPSGSLADYYLRVRTATLIRRRRRRRGRRQRLQRVAGGFGISPDGKPPR